MKITDIRTRGARVARATWWHAAPVLAVLALAALALVGALVALGARGVCATEDSASCVWVGPVQGNGRGAWLVVNGRDGADAPPVLYVDPRSR